MRSPTLSTAFLRPPLQCGLGSMCHGWNAVGLRESAVGAAARAAEVPRRVEERDCLLRRRGVDRESAWVVSCLRGGPAGMMLIVGSGSTANRVSLELANGLVEGSFVGDRGGVANRLLSLRSSTMLLSGPLLLGCRLWLGMMSDGLSGLSDVVVPTAAWRRCATAGMTGVAAFWAGCSGVGGADSPRTAVVGRKREAITTRWLRKEDILKRES